jgi:hypothetical protein
LGADVSGDGLVCRFRSAKALFGGVSAARGAGDWHIHKLFRDVLPPS